MAVLDSRYRKLDSLISAHNATRIKVPTRSRRTSVTIWSGASASRRPLLCRQRRDLDGPADVKIDVAVVEDLGLREIEGNSCCGLNGAAAGDGSSEISPPTRWGS
jgi:hypothetical protein